MRNLTVEIKGKYYKVKKPVFDLIHAISLERDGLKPNRFPRRMRVDLYSPAELAIYEATQKVEEAGADVKLTEAVILLGKAKELVADYVDEN